MHKYFVNVDELLPYLQGNLFEKDEPTPTVDYGQIMAQQAEQTRQLFQEQMAADKFHWEQQFKAQHAQHQDVMNMMREEAQRREQIMYDRMEKQDAAIREHHEQQMNQMRQMMMEKEREMTRQ